MRSRSILRITLAIAIVLAIGLVLRAGENNKPLQIALDQSQYDACGLEKLTDQEQQHLFGLIAACPRESYLYESAAAKFLSDGWREIRVVGALRKVPGSDDKLVVVLDEYELIALDPIIVPHLPGPGAYWAKTAGTSWTLLFPDGREYSFWERSLD